MGLFDHLRCETPLPRSREPLPEGVVFQTKDTPDQALTHYVLGTDGLMRENLGAGGGLFREREPDAARGLSTPLPLHQIVAFYHSEGLPARSGVDPALVNRRGWILVGVRGALHAWAVRGHHLDAPRAARAGWRPGLPHGRSAGLCRRRDGPRPPGHGAGL